MSNKFNHRSCKSELMDAFYIPKELLYQNLHELDILNRTLGGHAITLNGIKKLVTDKTKTYHIVDLGCGSGDALMHIAVWARAHDYKVRLTGVDINADAINYLKNHCKDFPEISGVLSDWHDFLNGNIAFDIIQCSLFCHHLNEDELKELFYLIQRNAKTGFVINDLRRNWIAYYSVYLLTRLLLGSALSKNDGPISVLRGFKSAELIDIIQYAHIKNYSINRKWAFRYLIIGKATA